MKKKEIDLHLFKKKYLDENLTISQCAQLFDCGKTTITRFCKKHSIVKPKEMINKNMSAGSKKHDHRLIVDLYLKDNLTRQQIANRLNIKKGAVDKVVSTSGKTKTRKQIKKNQIKLKISREELEDLYVNKNMSLEELCCKFKIGHTALRGALKRYGISKPEDLRQQLVRESFIKTGKMNSIGNLSTNELSQEIGLSSSFINKFIKDNPNMSDDEVLGHLKDLKDSSKSNLEKKMELNLSLGFFNKKIENSSLKYKPDFKLNDTTYINVDGLYWHSETKQKDNRYHFNMRKGYEQNNLRVMQFREDEIRDKMPIVKSMIGAVRGDSVNIYARKCSVEVISQKEANVFLEENHLMGKFSAKHIGLKYGGELVFLVSYKIYKDVLKIDRLCGKINTRVLGGFSKLLKRIESSVDFKTIHYWVDLRYGTGSFLLNLGFNLEKETLGWKWTNFSETYNRRKVRANMDDRKLREREYANELGLVKIYDAGQRLYTR